MTCVHTLDRTRGLDLIIHTEGGNIGATQSLVHYLQQMFEKDVRAIVPQIAMSAGTIVTCCTKSIVMGKQSNLGPIDPHIAGIPTKLATDWSKPEPGLQSRLLKWIDVNPGYSDKMHLIREWYVEFAPDGTPWREIGLDSEGVPVLAGPSETDYEFWLDTRMRLDDFTGEPTSTNALPLNNKPDTFRLC